MRVIDEWMLSLVKKLTKPTLPKVQRRIHIIVSSPCAVSRNSMNAASVVTLITATLPTLEWVRFQNMFNLLNFNPQPTDHNEYPSVQGRSLNRR